MKKGQHSLTESVALKAPEELLYCAIYYTPRLSVSSYRTTSFSKRPNMRFNAIIESTASFTTFTAMKKSFNDSGHTITGRCRYGAKSLSHRWEGVVAMGIPCANPSVATMDNQLRFLIGANASTELYRLALGRRNERSATCSLALNLPIAIRTFRNVLVSAFHTHFNFNSELADMSIA